MTHSSTRTKLIAAITVLAVMLACVFAAIFYTRTQDALTPEDVPSGESASAFPLDYGDPLPTETIPSDAKKIENQQDFYEFINGTASYGYLTTNITLSTWVRGDLVLDSGRTLDGRGKTVTIVNDTTSSGTKPSAGADRALAHTMLSVFDADYRGSNHIGERGWYDAWWGADNMSGNNYSINGKQSYALSDIVSVNRGTIKNLKVQMNGHSDGVVDHIALATEDGNVSMGVIAGINEGDIINCTVDVNDRYGIVPSDIVVTGKSNVSLYSRQDMVAVGGVVGYNTGNIVGTEVNLNNGSLGIYRSQKRFREDKIVNPAEGTISNMSIDSGSLGGVAGINDGGTITGLDFYINNCWLYNDAWHWQTSYTGLLVGLSNSSNAAADYNLDGSNWTIDPGVITNLTIDWAEGVKVATEAHGNGSLSGYRDSGRGASISAGDYGTGMPQGNWQAVGNYVGIVAGRMTTAAGGADYISTQINVYNTNFNKSVNGNNGVRWNFHPWATNEVNNGYGNEYPITDPYFPIYGYGNNEAAYGTITTIDTKLEGQYLSGENTGTSITSQGATASYIWSGGVGASDEAYSGLLQNIELSPMFDNVEPSIYRFVGYVGGEQTSSAGSTNYMGDIGKSNLLIVPTDTTGSQISIEYRYSVTAKALPTAASLDAFFGVNPGSGFGYAYANAVILNADNTVSGTLAPSGSRVFPSWKTLDGQGHRLTVTSSNAVSGSGAQVTTGGQTFNAYGDLISVNNGVINSVVFRQIGGGERADITGVSGNAAYGNVVGVNNGTMNAVYHNNAGGEALRTVVSTSGAYLALGGVAGINLGTINDTASIVWNDFQGSAQTGTFVGGVVGLNMGGGTLKNAKIDGVATATMKASRGEAYLGGVLGLGANGSNGGRTVGGLSVTSSLTSSPFENWFFAGKQTLDQTSGAYVGMLSGGVTSAPNETDRPLLGMIVLMPDTQYDLGWFTDRTNTPSLLGRSNGAASVQGYIATSMVGGYSVVAQDASNLYISAAISDYNGSLINGAFSGTFAINTTYIRGTAEPIVYYEHIADVGATVSGDSISVPSNASGLSVIDNTDNTENYAQTIALRYVYEIGIDQTANDADGSTSEHALRLFLSGDALGAGLEKYPGSYKAIAAGATSAVITSDLTLSADPNGIVFAAPKVKLDGGGHTVTINNNVNGTLQGGATYELGGVARNVYGELVAINRAEITDVKLNVSGSRDLNGDNVVYGAIGVNVGGTGEIGNEVRAYIDGVDVTWAQNVSLSGGGDQIFGGIVGIAGYPGNVDNSDLVVNGNVSLTGSYNRANVGAYGYIFGGSVGGTDGTKATWMGDVTMRGADNADVIFGGVAATFNTGYLVGASATFGSTSSWQGYLNGHLYDNAFDLTVNGGNVMVGGVVGHMPGDGNLNNSSALFNVDFEVVKTGASSTYNVDVGGVIGQITAGTATSATVSGLGGAGHGHDTHGRRGRRGRQRSDFDGRQGDARRRTVQCQYAGRLRLVERLQRGRRDRERRGVRRPRRQRIQRRERLRRLAQDDCFARRRRQRRRLSRRQSLRHDRLRSGAGICAQLELRFGKRGHGRGDRRYDNGIYAVGFGLCLHQRQRPRRVYAALRAGGRALCRCDGSLRLRTEQVQILRLVCRRADGQSDPVERIFHTGLQHLSL